MSKHQKYFQIPNFQIQNFQIPKFHIPKFQIPKFQIPKFQISNIQIPNFQIPSFQTLNFQTKPKFKIKLLSLAKLSPSLSPTLWDCQGNNMYKPVLLYPALSVPLINFNSVYISHTIVQLITLNILTEIASTFHFHFSLLMIFKNKQ